MSKKKRKVAPKPKQSNENVSTLLPPGVKLLHTLRGHEDWIGRLKWSPNGRILASPSGDGTIRLWDTETGSLLKTLRGHKESVTAVAFDSTGSKLASGGGDEHSSNLDATIYVWDVAGGTLCQQFGKHKNSVSSLAFHPSGQTLVSGSYDESVTMWEVSSGNLLLRFRESRPPKRATRPKDQIPEVDAVSECPFIPMDAFYSSLVAKAW